MKLKKATLEDVAKVVSKSLRKKFKDTGVDVTLAPAPNGRYYRVVATYKVANSKDKTLPLVVERRFIIDVRPDSLVERRYESKTAMRTVERRHKDAKKAVVKAGRLDKAARKKGRK